MNDTPKKDEPWTEDENSEEIEVLDTETFVDPPEQESATEAAEIELVEAGDETEPEEEMVPLAVAEEYRLRAQSSESKLLEFSEAFTRYREEHDRVRARLERDQETRVRDTLARTFRELLGALDNFERTFEHAEEGPLTEGLRLVHKQFLDILAAEGLQRLEVLGKAFDPKLAEAVMVTPTDDAEEKGKVLEEFRCGYRFKELVIRPAQVRVGQS